MSEVLKFSDLDMILQDFDFSDWERLIPMDKDENLYDVNPVGLSVEAGELVMVVDVEIMKDVTFAIRMDQVNIPVSKIKNLVHI